MKSLTRGNGHQTKEAYRKALLDKKAEILIALGINCRELADPEQRLGADADKIAHDEFVRLRMNRVLNGLLRQVEDALERLVQGEYGICGSCGSVIPSLRLQAVPWARFCLTCQEQTTPFSVTEVADVGKEY